MKCVNWEVGSTWYSDIASLPEVVHNRSIEAEGVSFVSSGRSSIGAILDRIETNSVAFVPAFTCHSVLQPFVERGYQIYAYPVNPDLSVDWPALVDMVKEYQPKVIVLHGYFGFNTLNDSANLLDELRHNDIIIIEDQTQTMFSKFQPVKSDFKVGSIRKWVPIPDGAFVLGLELEGLKEDTEFSGIMKRALDLKRDYIFRGMGDKAEIMSLFSCAKKVLASRNKVYAMSAASKKYLEDNNWTRFINARRENYEYLAGQLQDISQLEVIRTHLNDDEVPFMLPLYITSGRAEFQSFMAQHNVYPTIIWTCPEAFANTVPVRSAYIYDNILCFYIDQRYNLDDMKRVAEIVKIYFQQLYD